MTQIFAYAACVILFLLALFQLALILGAPIGKYAWGGSHRVLPTKLRIGSSISIGLYAIFGLIILHRAGVIAVINNDMVISVSAWIITAYFFIGVLMNGISRSMHERSLMTPVALLLAILSLLIALD